MDSKVVKVGLVGFGTVGSGVAKIILEDADAIEAKTGLRLELTCVVDKDITSPRPVELPNGILTDNINVLLDDSSIDVGVELVGGTTFAKDIQIDMLKSGKDVVTANKALLAKFGNDIYAVARQRGRCVAFEASCAGGIPVVSAIRIGLAANRVKAIYGILNGTCNYILSQMSAQNEDFPIALAQAQEKGYAEADPTLDINGADRDVYVHNRRTKTTKLASISSGGTGGNGHSDRPSISPDGRFVAFASDAGNLVGGDTLGEQDVFIHDRKKGKTKRITIDKDNAEADGRSGDSSISSGGRFVAFDSRASNLIGSDTNFDADVFRRGPLR